MSLQCSAVGGVNARGDLAMRHAGRSGFRAPAQPNSAPPNNLQHQMMDDANQHVLGSQSKRGTLSDLNTWSRESFPQRVFTRPLKPRATAQCLHPRVAPINMIDLLTSSPIRGASMRPACVGVSVCVWVCFVRNVRVALPTRFINKQLPVEHYYIFCADVFNIDL